MRATVPLKKQYEIIDTCMEYRLKTIVPAIMSEYGFDMWIVMCREYNEDPIYTTMVPSLCLTARRLSCLVFILEDGKLQMLNYGKADGKIEKIYEQGYTDTSVTQLEALAQLITKHNPKKIGLNMSNISGMTDGLSHKLYADFTKLLTPEQVSRIAPAFPLATRWIETRTQEELARYPGIYALAMNICEEAFSSAVITPGVTTSTEVEEWIGQQINDLGLTFWFSPHVDIQRCGLSGNGVTDLVIMPGDILHYDVGLKYFGLCTDSQRMAYVLKPGEETIPKYILDAFAKTSRFQDIVCQEHIIGKTGNEILKAALERGRKEGLCPMLYNHPIGFFGHSAGTVVGLWDMQGGIGDKGEFPLHPNTCYALELNTESVLPEWGGQVVRFSAEETVAFTENGKLAYMFPGRDKMYAI